MTDTAGGSGNPGGPDPEAAALAKRAADLVEGSPPVVATT
jgi:hypothetical protein